MGDMTFTVNEALEFASRGDIEEWVHLFLNSVGDNKPFSDGLKLQKRYWLGPFHIELEKLRRCCGPEPEMQFIVTADGWESHISYFQKLIKDGWNIPPLIAYNQGDYLVVNDGNHRLEAMRREGIEKWWVIIWESNGAENLKQWSKYMPLGVNENEL